MTKRAVGLLLAGALACALAGCDRGATASPDAAGSPGTGNARATTAPLAPDSQPGDAVPGTTGGGTAGTSTPGTGLQGGLGRSGGMGMSGSFPAASTSAVAAGRNTTPTGSTGNRP